MKKLFVIFLALLMVSPISKSSCQELEVRSPSEEEFFQQSQWGLSGFSLIADDRTIYIPLRRTQGWREEGQLRKVSPIDGLWTEDPLWDGEPLEGTRKLLVPRFSEGSFFPGPLESLSDQDPELQSFMGLDDESWQEFLRLRYPERWGAPRSLVCVGATEAFQSRRTVIYAHCSDGVLSAIDSASGKELWAFMAPSVLGDPRMKTALETTGDQPSPWLTEGALSAEDVVIGGQTRTLLVGTLGRGGRGVYCLDITDPDVPEYLWCREDTSQGIWMFDGSCEGAQELGFTDGPAVLFPAGDGQNLALGSGEETEGRLLWLDSQSGKTVSASKELDGELIWAPAAFCDVFGELEILLCSVDRQIVAFVVRNETFVPSVVYRSGTGMSFQGAPAVAWLRKRRCVAALERSGSSFGVTLLELTGQNQDFDVQVLWSRTDQGEPIGGPQIYGEQVLVLIQRGSQRELLFWDLWSGSETARITLENQNGLPMILNGKILEIFVDGNGLSVEEVGEISARSRPAGVLYRALF